MTSPSGRLPTLLLAAYAAPALPLAVLTLPLYIVVPNYYATALGVPLALVGQVLLIVRLFDAITDPIVGVLADRYRPAFGRRRLWFLAAMPVTVVAVWLVFVPPAGAGAWWLLAFGSLLSLATTASLIPYWAWGAELSPDYGERSRISGIREGVVVLGTLVATAMPAIVEGFGAKDAGVALMALAVLVAVLLPPAVLLAVWRVPEPHDHSKATLDLKGSLAALGSNKPFLRLLAAFVLNGIANGLPATLFLFFVTDVLAAPDQAGIALLAYFLAGMAGVPLFLGLARRWSKHRVWSVAMIGACCVFALVPALGAGDIWIFIGIATITGLALGADLVLPASIQADVIDVDTARTGAQRSGTYVAAWGLATKIALALAVGVSFPLLDLAGFRTDGGAQTESALMMLAFLYAGLPVVMKLAAIALMWNFPIGAAEQAALRAEIEARRTDS